MAYTTDPQGLDPHRTAAVATFNITGSIYDTLLAVTPTGRLSHAWRKAIRYHLMAWRSPLTWRKGVKFHNGREMKAQDVKFSFERLKGEDSPKAGDYKNIDGIEVLDDYTIKFTTTNLDVELVKAFTYPWTAIVPLKQLIPCKLIL